MAKKRGDYTLGFGLLGFVYFCAVGMLSIGLTGGGHGWNAAIISVAGAIFVPAFGVALASPREERRPTLLMIAAAMILGDALLVLMTEAEGASYLWKVWAATPGSIVLWAVLWIAWQFAVVGALARDILAARRR